MIFESWLPHAVSGNRSTGRRVAVVADLKRTR
jgi:ectoine hydroxylase-related dioxygenase (phytanoyl-CoA dioxygenase family)